MRNNDLISNRRVLVLTSLREEEHVLTRCTVLEAEVEHSQGYSDLIVVSQESVMRARCHSDGF